MTPIRRAALAVLVLCLGCGGATAGGAGTTGPADAPGPDLSTPEGLVQAVFESIRAGDVEAYLRLYPSEAEDFEALAAMRQPPPPPPSDEQLAAMREHAAEGFRTVLDELRRRGLDPSSARLVEARTDRAVVQGRQGFAEDLTAVIAAGEVTVPVTIDDCLLAPRGWLILDGLRLRE